MSEGSSTGTRIAEAPGYSTAEELEAQLAAGTLAVRSGWFHVLYNWKNRELITVKSTRETLELPSLRDEWERLYYCQVDLPIPVRGDMTTIKTAAGLLRDTDDKLDLENHSLAFEFGRRLYSQILNCLPHISPENRMNAAWQKSPHTECKDDIQYFWVENHGQKLRVIIEAYTDEKQQQDTIRKELDTLQGRLDGIRKQVEVEDGVVVAEEMIRREAVEKLLKTEQTLATTLAKQVVELQGKLETAKLDVAAARRERDEVQLEINRMKQLQCPNCEGLKTVVKQALIECNVYAGTAEIDNIGSILRGGG